jgi:hypothetical protein
VKEGVVVGGWIARRMSVKLEVNLRPTTSPASFSPHDSRPHPAIVYHKPRLHTSEQ